MKIVSIIILSIIVLNHKYDIRNVFSTYTLCAVPRGPPLSVSVNVLNATCAIATWNAPSLTERNGLITHYVVNVSEIDTFHSLSQLSTQSYLELSSLHPSYTYQIRVAAATALGVGPYSVTNAFTMDESGKFPQSSIMNIIYVEIQHFMSSSKWSTREYYCCCC